MKSWLQSTVIQTKRNYAPKKKNIKIYFLYYLIRLNVWLVIPCLLLGGVWWIILISKHFLGKIFWNPTIKSIPLVDTSTPSLWSFLEGRKGVPKNFKWSWILKLVLFSISSASILIRKKISFMIWLICNHCI